MKYLKFIIENYRAIKKKLEIDLSRRIVPLVGINECGKTTILKAILCFDFTNDSINESEHINTTQNLYETGKKKPTKIAAMISCTEKEFSRIFDNTLNLTIGKKGTDKWKDEYQGIIDDLTSFKSKNKSVKQLTITRTFDDAKHYYSSMDLEGLSPASQNFLCKEIVRNLPYILYNDDFTDRPECAIKIGEEGSRLSSWEAIFDSVVASTSEGAYGLRDIAKENDARQRISMLSDVKNHLDQALTAAWSKFSPKAESIKTKLELDITSKTLYVYIIEENKGVERSFYITDRSKGFIWYYNFIMKVRFNPKNIDGSNSTIFLLDEPGSYLHEKLQAELCKKLKEISASEGNVIYCTHSPRLLDPEHIPLSSVLIVEKKGTEISATLLPQVKTKSKNNAAMQPIYEALQLPEFEQISKDEKVLCVEGIYDKYAISCFCELPEYIRVFPSTSAAAISENIQYFIAYQKDYLALWDCDEEGKRARGRANTLFGNIEADRFLILPEHIKPKMRMEEMIEESDYELLKKELHLPDDAKYETIISQLFFNKASTKKISNMVSAKTKSNFAILQNMICKKLSLQ